MNFSMPVPNEKIKKYFVPAIAGAAAITGAIVLIIVIVVRGSKEAQKKQTRQKEEGKSEEFDKCKGLMEQFLIHKDGGMNQERLNEFYDRCAAECPDDFTPRERKDAPNSEKVRARLAQRKVERKVKSGVNNDLNQSKGNKPSETLKPAAVVQPNDNKPELRPSIGEKNDAGKVSKKSNERNEDERSRVPLKETLDVNRVNGVSTDNKKQEFTSKTDTKYSKDALKPNTSKDSSKADTKGTKDYKALAPEELKKERVKANKELRGMIIGMLDSGKPKNAFDANQEKRIVELSDQGLLPPYYRWPRLVKEFWQGELLKLYKSGDVAKAQEMFKTFLKKFSLFDDDDDDESKVPKGSIITEFNDYKFWKAVTDDNQAEAVKLLDQPIFLPTFIRDALKMKPEKLKLFKGLSDVQMDALWEYCLLDKEREKYLGYFNITGNETRMTEVAADYNRIAEQMRLLSGDIHAEFDFVVPNLPLKKSYLEEVEEYLKDKIKMPGFEAALKKLREDKALSVSLVMDATYEVSKPEDQAVLLEAVKS